MVLCPRSGEGALASGHGTTTNPLSRARRGTVSAALGRWRRRCRPSRPPSLATGAGPGRERPGARTSRVRPTRTPPRTRTPTRTRPRTRPRTPPRTRSAGAQGEHGALVSAVAQNEACVGGPNDNHGWAVSQVARGLLVPDALTGCPIWVPPVGHHADDRHDRRLGRARQVGVSIARTRRTRPSTNTPRPDDSSARRARIEPGPFDSPGRDVASDTCDQARSGGRRYASRSPSRGATRSRGVS